MALTLTRSQYVRWRNAIFAVFLCSGASVATWASRLPDIKRVLEIDNAQVGLLLLGMGVASIVGISTSPALMGRIGARHGMLSTMVLLSVGIALIGTGTTVLGSLPVVVVGLVLFGFGNGCLDIMMNVEATVIEQHAQRTIMPLFHAFFSFGTVLGAGLGVLATWLSLTVSLHAAAISTAIVATGIISIANVPRRERPIGRVPDADHATGTDATGGAARTPWRERMHVSLAAWREPRTYALGVIMLGMSFAEGGANDWLALGAAEAHGHGPEMGAVALTVFSVGMTTVRVLGGPLVDRVGRVVVLRVLAVAAAGGILLFILAPSLPLVFVGAALWGIGASLGFPLGMSAAADDPAKAAARVSAAAMIGYVAFLGGPPVLGMVSEHISLLNTLFILVGLVIASGLFSGAAKPLSQASRVGAGAR